LGRILSRRQIAGTGKRKTEEKKVLKGNPGEKKGVIKHDTKRKTRSIGRKETLSSGDRTAQS